jgi:hypothetical protein
MGDKVLVQIQASTVGGATGGEAVPRGSQVVQRDPDDEGEDLYGAYRASASAAGAPAQAEIDNGDQYLSIDDLERAARERVEPELEDEEARGYDVLKGH